MPKPFQATATPAGHPSMFLVFRWTPGELPPSRPAPPRPVVPPAPERARTARDAIAVLRAAGTATLADIARALNARQVPTLSGRGAWHGAQVARAEGRPTP